MIRLAAQQPNWVLGVADETWGSRRAQPALHHWTAGKPLRLIEPDIPTGDPDPKALACYGLLRTATQEVWLRCGEGRPVSHVTLAFLGWVCERLAAERPRVLVLLGDNASWHISREVRTWIRAHPQKAKAPGGVRLLAWRVPVPSPWLNPIAPHGIPGKRALVEPARLVTAAEIITRVCAYFGCEHAAHRTHPVP